MEQYTHARGLFAMVVNDLIKELDEARQLAKDNNKPTAMINATMSKAKLLGLDSGVIDDEAQPNKVVIQVEDARLRHRQLIN